MATETERKFLVDTPQWKLLEKPPGRRFRQGYLSLDPARTIRIRIGGDEAWLTIKGAGSGISREEIECPLPVAVAGEMLDSFSLASVTKTRYDIRHGGMLWEVDVFEGDNEGLILAEIELESEDQPFPKPSWAGLEVSHDHRYFNAQLARNPYRSWKQHV